MNQAPVGMMNVESGGSVGPAVINLESSASDDAAVSGDNTFSTLAIGTAAADRKIVVCVMSRATGLINSVTVGGISATRAAESKSTWSDPNGFSSEIWIASVPTGTTADVVVNTPSDGTWIDIAVYSATAMGSTPTDTGSVEGAANPSDTLTGIDGGACFACASTNPSGGTIAAWTGVTEDYEERGGGNDMASAASATLTGNITVTCTITGGGSSYDNLAIVTFPPA